MFFLNANEIAKAQVKHNQEFQFYKRRHQHESLSEKVKQENLSGMLITMEECFIQKELFGQK